MRHKNLGTSSHALYGKTEDRYFDLIRRFPLRPLQSEADLDAAISIIDELLDREKMSPPERDYFEVLSDLVEDYEAEAVPISTVGDAEILRFLIENRGATQTQVAGKTGIAESTISEILAGKRKLNRNQIGKLARYFKIGPGTFAFAE
jgi:HTH-type transcriptional regulator/antitoxin HigA